jgi:hypothetical protein
VVVVRRRGLCWWVGQLNSRAIVEVRGRDAARFLQGLTTNDLLALPPSPPPPPSSSAVPQLAAAPAPAPHSCYTAFLTPTGRFLADALVSLSHNSTSPATTQARQLPDSDVRSTTTTTAPRDGGGGGTQHHLVGGDPEQQSFLVECDARAAPGLVLHLRRYRLRAQVDIVPPAQQADGGWTVGALLTGSTPEEGGEAASEAILQRLRAQAPTLVRPPCCCHCHNDAGDATTNCALPGGPRGSPALSILGRRRWGCECTTAEPVALCLRWTLQRPAPLSIAFTVSFMLYLKALMN